MASSENKRSEPISVNLFIDMQSKQTQPRPRTTIGQLQQVGSSMYLTYKEDEQDMGNTVTRFKWDIGNTDGFTLMRNGDVSMRQRMQPGTVTFGRYESPYGAFHMETETRQATFQWNGNSGEIRLDYRLRMDEEDLGRFRLYVKMEKENP